MGSSKRKAHSLKIDTISISNTSNNTKQRQVDTDFSLPSLFSWSDENDTEEDILESPGELIHDWNSNSKTQNSMLPTNRNHDHHDHYEQSPVLLLSDSKKKKWFQISRNALKIYLSTPPRRDYGGLKTGSVEPPKHPLQLLFNLQWSTSKEGNGNNNINSTSNSTVLNPHFHTTFISTVRPELLSMASFSPYSFFSINFSSSTINPSMLLRKAHTSRRFSLPVPELPTKTQQKKNTFVKSLAYSPGSLLHLTLSNHDDNKFDIPTLYFSDGKPVIIFSNIKSRKHKLSRKASLKTEYNALCIWRSTLDETLAKRQEYMTIPLKKTAKSPKTHI